MTNRRNDSAIQICEYLKISNIIAPENIFSSINDGTINPKSSSLSKVISSKYSNNLEGCYVGDSSVDIESAISNKLHPVYVSDDNLDSIISVFNLKVGYNLCENIEDLVDII